MEVPERELLCWLLLIQLTAVLASGDTALTSLIPTRNQVVSRSGYIGFNPTFCHLSFDPKAAVITEPVHFK